MSQSLAKVYLHLVFSTKERMKLITPNIETRLHNYMSSIGNKIGCPVHQIGGTEDHVHILLEQSRNVTIAKLLETIKANSSRWIKNECKHFSWQSGYGAFSIDQKTYEGVKKYIINQKIHHQKRTFKEEFLLLLKRANIPIDERYLWN